MCVWERGSEDTDCLIGSNISPYDRSHKSRTKSLYALDTHTDESGNEVKEKSED